MIQLHEQNPEPSSHPRRSTFTLHQHTPSYETTQRGAQMQDLARHFENALATDTHRDLEKVLLLWHSNPVEAELMLADQFPEIMQHPEKKRIWTDLVESQAHVHDRWDDTVYEMREIRSKLVPLTEDVSRRLTDFGETMNSLTLSPSQKDLYLRLSSHVEEISLALAELRFRMKLYLEADLNRPNIATSLLPQLFEQIYHDQIVRLAQLMESNFLMGYEVMIEMRQALLDDLR